TNPFVSKKVINDHNEKFDKPAIIISNHTSFLDTLAVGMLNPKIIFLVNDWVYNSPVFGRAVKLAGFYPVSQGLEGGVEHLREKINEGFSLVIFPEGQRSEDNGVKRFHKGAFYLSKEFNVAILPIYIHGNADALPKGDHIIYDEQITVKIGERIEATDVTFGNDYAEKTKKISKYFKENFNSLRGELEDENYFKNKLLLSFLYKEREIVASVRSDFDKNKTLYFKLNKKIDSDAKVLHLANDYGQLDVLLTLQESKRKIQSYIVDEQKRNVAKTNYILKKRSIDYLDSVLENDKKWNTLLISNVDSAIVKALDWPNSASQVVLMGSFELENYFISLGFVVVNQEYEILVLKK
uniref:lysophospholipid acyltransferase family protein n=1 Tax=Flavobacterium sp. TaxID=239 RepID=UPI002624CB2F